jgi:hypothetical protein
VVCWVSSDLIKRQVPTSRHVLPFSSIIELSSVPALITPLSALMCIVRLLLEFYHENLVGACWNGDFLDA